MNFSFFERYAELCKSIGETPNSVAKAVGASSGSVTAWKNGTEPRYSTVVKIADYLGVSTDYLLGIAKEYKKAPTLTAKDERDIAKTLESVMADLEHSGDLMFDGNPMSDEARESIRSALKLGLEAAKLKNKEIYTPKKYRKG